MGLFIWVYCEHWRKSCFCLICSWYLTSWAMHYSYCMYSPRTQETLAPGVSKNVQCGVVVDRPAGLRQCRHTCIPQQPAHKLVTKHMLMHPTVLTVVVSSLSVKFLNSLKFLTISMNEWIESLIEWIQWLNYQLGDVSFYVCIYSPSPMWPALQSACTPWITQARMCVKPRFYSMRENVLSVSKEVLDR